MYNLYVSKVFLLEIKKEMRKKNYIFNKIKIFLRSEASNIKPGDRIGPPKTPIGSLDDFGKEDINSRLLIVFSVL